MLALAVAMLAPGAVSAAPPSDRKAPPAALERKVDHEMEIKAREAFAAGRYDEALQLFAKLYAETLHPVYLRNIGRCHQKLREPQRAIDSFLDYMAKSRKLTAEEQGEIEGYIREMETLRQEQEKKLAAATAGGGTGGAAAGGTQPAGGGSGGSSGALAMNGGAGGGAGPDLNPHPETDPTVVGGPKPASSPPVYTRWWFWTGVVVVVAGAVVGVLLLTSGNDKNCPTGVRC